MATPPSRETALLDIDALRIDVITEQGDVIHVVRDLELHLSTPPAEGQVVVCLGPASCGMSTALRAIAGLVRPSSGSLRLRGRSIDGPHPQRSLVPAQDTAFPWKTVAENVGYGLALARAPRREREAQVETYLRRVGLADFADVFPAALSSGMVQRLAMARALVMKPALLLLDEPFRDLDPHTRGELQNLVLQVARQESLTTLLATHDVTEAVYLADHLFILAPRPTRVLERLELPRFDLQGAELKASPAFQESVRTVLTRLQRVAGIGDLRISP